MHVHADSLTRHNNSLGFISAIGIIGNKLKDIQESKTFISADSGKSWIQVDDSPCLVKISMQGSLMLKTPIAQCDEVFYSLNHGSTWKKIKLEINQKPLRIESLEDSFILFGKTSLGIVSTYIGFEHINSCKLIMIERLFKVKRNN